MPKSKHLILSERIIIEHMIRDSFSFKVIARELGRDCTSISKEIRYHIILKKTGSYKLVPMSRTSLKRALISQEMISVLYRSHFFQVPLISVIIIICNIVLYHFFNGIKIGTGF